jgi:hypothetical protein
MLSEMFLCLFNFRNRIAWSLSSEDPVLFPLPGTREWSMVNPLLYPQLRILAQKTDPPIRVPSGQHLWFNSEIVLAREENSSGSANDPKRLIPVVGELLLRLRHLTGQATLPGPESLLATGFLEVDELPANWLLIPGPWDGLISENIFCEQR